MINNFNVLGGQVGFFTSRLGALVFILILIWTIVWKALALWKSARAGSKWWFVVLLILNTLGILDILYLYYFSKSAKEEIKAPTEPPSEKK